VATQIANSGKNAKERDHDTQQMAVDGETLFRRRSTPIFLIVNPTS
jgi:hypothetical protein